MPTRGDRLWRTIAIAQGTYFALSGAWPLIHMRSFLAVTGPKTDLWLVETVGILVVAIGLTLLVAARIAGAMPVAATLGVSAALGLGAIETIYALIERIRWVYLVDGAIELVIVAAWGWALRCSFSRGR